MPSWRIYIASNNKRYLGFNVKRPIFSSDFKQIRSFSRDFHGSPQYQISRKSALDALEYTDRRRDITWLIDAFRSYTSAPKTDLVQSFFLSPYPLKVWYSQGTETLAQEYSWLVSPLSCCNTWSGQLRWTIFAVYQNNSECPGDLHWWWRKCSPCCCMRGLFHLVFVLGIIIWGQGCFIASTTSCI